MDTAFIKAFDTFINAYKSQSDSENQGLMTEYDSDWQSPCFELDNQLEDGDLVKWTPALRDPSANLGNIASALDLEIPAAFHHLFGRYYSFDLNAQTQRGKLTILQAINDEDFERLQKNLIAHVLMKRKLKQPETLFFAVTDEEDFVISLLPNSGEVVLEFVGKPHQEVLAENLTAFFTSLDPVPTKVSL
ncbi:SecY-interacting protein [Glaciecola sp. 1036]|uniref:SecY-interacting protein n=1 Tax=Alteromonadaceae TaxID=72275 RepID=UPI003CFFFBFF